MWHPPPHYTNLCVGDTVCATVSVSSLSIPAVCGPDSLPLMILDTSSLPMSQVWRQRVGNPFCWNLADVPRVFFITCKIYGTENGMNLCAFIRSTE